ncbi:uncharacterized [Tachysurus ichikawai]
MPTIPNDAGSDANPAVNYILDAILLILAECLEMPQITGTVSEAVLWPLKLANLLLNCNLMHSNRADKSRHRSVMKRHAGRKHGSDKERVAERD